MRRLGLDEMERECGSRVQGVLFYSGSLAAEPIATSSHINFYPVPTLYFPQRAQPPSPTNSSTSIAIIHHYHSIHCQRPPKHLPFEPSKSSLSVARAVFSTSVPYLLLRHPTLTSSPPSASELTVLPNATYIMGGVEHSMF